MDAKNSITQSGTSPPPTLTAALAYSKRGWQVFPVYGVGPDGSCACGKDCDSPYKHPMTRNGCRDATTDHDKIRSWFTRYPTANIGIATGPESDLLVIDPDGKDGMAWASRVKLIASAAYYVKTPRGGMHIYYRYPDDSHRYPNSTGKLAPSVDVRGDGGYVIVPPSVTDSGAYVLLADDEPAEAPEDLLAQIRAARNSSGPQARAVGGGQKIVEGGRNAALTSEGGSLRRRDYSEKELFASLSALNEERCDPTLPESEIARIARSLMRYEPGAEKYRRTDQGNAPRLVDLHGDELRYCYSWNTWLAWDGIRWNRDQSNEVRRRAVDVTEGMVEEAAGIDTAEAKVLFKFAMQSQRQSNIKAMVEAASNDREIQISSDHLDTDPWLLNVRNGTIDLRTGELRPHNHGDLLTKLAPVEFDPDAAAPTWKAYLDRIFDGDQALIRFVQRVIGTFLTGDVSEQKLFFAHGLGANGKSVLVRVLQELLGGYAIQAESDLLAAMKRDSRRATPELADLAGVRFAATVEVDDGTQLAEALVKQLTGGDRIKARWLHSNPFEFDPTHKIMLVANHKPEIKGTDHAIWRRICMIPFEVTIPADEQDPRLVDKLTAEGPGILNWAVEGCLSWQRDGLQIPDKVQAATAAYRHEQDPVSQFLDSRCVRDSDAFTPTADLLDAYNIWAEANGRRRYARSRDFGQRLAQENDLRGGPKKVDKKTVRGWHGIAIKDVVDLPVDLFGAA